jgi:hypothetical protein
MGWTDISASRKDADSPLDEDLFSDLDDNTTYNYERAIRSGTHATGVRTAMARGKTSFSGSSISTIDVVLDFTAADDGAPSFSASPIVTTALEENTSGSSWATVIAAHHIKGGTLSATGCTIDVNWGGQANYQGWVHWVAIGDVTSGE